MLFRSTSICSTPVGSFTCKTVRHAPLVYRVEEIAQLLAISNRTAYNLCNTTKDFKVIRLGTSIRVSKQSFDDWFAAV